MANNKSLLAEHLKKTLAVGLPVIALSGFVPGAALTSVANAEGLEKVVASEAKAKGAVAEAESALSKAKSEAEATSEAAEAKSAVSEAEAKAKAEAESKY